jgi:hypothetical protein
MDAPDARTPAPEGRRRPGAAEGGAAFAMPPSEPPMTPVFLGHDGRAASRLKAEAERADIRIVAPDARGTHWERRREPGRDQHRAKPCRPEAVRDALHRFLGGGAR